ncbi:MAG: hypothetical protein H8E44_13430 [Planctomycetes bacterium]|nr:hypothetical protein [Planctomycetota bacterium]MBL7039137.1 hypothetical protein [Pirellulaceae bacterium]
MSYRVLVLPVSLSLVFCLHPILAAADGAAIAELERLSKQGETLPIEVVNDFPLREQYVRDDTGINVLVDLAHQASFFAMWSVPGELRRYGFRASGSQASLDTVLTPGKPSRVRIPIRRRRPFAWWPNAKWNVVFTYQGGPQSQDYLPEERAALREFVEGGGGLVVACGNVFDDQQIAGWSLNRLLGDFDASLKGKAERVDGARVPTLELNESWEVMRSGEGEAAVAARRSVGKGRVVVFSSTNLVFWDRNAEPDAPNSRTNRGRQLADAVRWAAARNPPAGGSRRLPTEAAGGGPIYPELEQNVGGVIVYYAKNQKEELLQAVRDQMPKAKQQVEAWLPSIAPGEPMYLIVSAGGGGGWAVNAYLPKETGVISLSPHGLLSVFGHELAHTMTGPPNDQGKTAASWPQGNQGESHAGWYQGKVIAMFGDDETRRKSNRDCNRFFRFDKSGSELDLAMDPGELRERWGKGKEWTKIWWVWQKLDDRYGPTWYPRWRWVQHTRWQVEPGKRLTWDETVEDMSIAVGEDLFPFFRKIGTTLDKERFPRATFQGKPIALPPASLDVTPAGSVRLGPIGDHRQAITLPPAG